jgi:hypothetical protein
MPPFRLSLLAGSLLVLLATAAVAHAGPVSWSFSWMTDPSNLTAGTGGVTFTNDPTDSRTDAADLIATHIRTFSAATADAPDHIDHAKYALTLTLTDDASAKTGSLTFTGALNGTMTAGGAAITNTFTGATTQSLTLGDHLFTVAIGPYKAPGAPDGTPDGTIQAHVAVSDAGPAPPPPAPRPHVRPPTVPPPISTPEPSTLLAAVLGCVLLGGARPWRRRAAA